MKTNWLILCVLIVVSLVLTGCPPAGGTGKTPPPRQAMDDTPDLYKGKFLITDKSLAGMRGDGMPDGVVGKLDGLKGQEYGNAKEFFNAVGGSIGNADLGKHRDVIVRHSLITDLAAEIAFPGQKLSLAAGGMGDGRFKPIFFEYDRSEVRPEFKAAIEHNASVLTGETGLKIVIEGHCDERGTTEYNLALGERRARAVRKALIEAGVDPKQMGIVSYGEERPAASGSNEEAWATNRRAVFQAK